MPEIGTLKRVEQGSINIVSVETAPVNPMKVDIATIDWHGAQYQGAYEITPGWQEQTLETKGKALSDDVTIHEIPVVRTTNPSGGVTIVIG